MWILVWALVARFMSNGCSSHVHRFPITWSPRDRLESMAGIYVADLFIRYTKEACLLFTLDNYASKFAEKETAKKHYFTDNGLLSIFLTDSKSPLLENLCAITLHKKYNRNYEMPKLYYYNQNIEVDFYVPDEGLAIQASFSLEDMDTRKRDVAALIALNKVFPIRKTIIITYDEEEIIEEDGITIEVIPIWKWLTE